MYIVICFYRNAYIIYYNIRIILGEKRSSRTITANKDVIFSEYFTG